ncbi:hypothetical protein ACIGZJ_09675 [Kitasatospora sp. NPDC052868]|uniref:hypothetical protein n=1 Tax=Kitasatospora sp. NPDC052868 TaxID=3364060 RepID=UPI0037C6CC87
MSGEATKSRSLVRLWIWIKRNQDSRYNRGASTRSTFGANLLDGALTFGVTLGLVSAGSQMAEHTEWPVVLAVAVPLLLWFPYMYYVVLRPLQQAEALLQQESRSPERLKAKVDRLRQALVEAATLSQQLEAELTVQVEALERIEAQKEHAKHLAQLDEAAAAAVKQALVDVTAGQQRHQGRVSFTYFALGVGATVAVVIFGHFIPVL